MTTEVRTSPDEGSPLYDLERRTWKVPIAFALLTIVSFVLFVLFAEDAVSNFNLASRGDLFPLPVVSVPTLAGGIVVTAIVGAIALAATWLVYGRRRVPMWLSVVGAIVALFGFLSWAAAGSTLQVPGLFTGAIALSVPLVFGAMGGVMSERVGVINIAIEGQLLGGAFASAVVASITGSPFAGLVAASVAGVLVSFVLAAFSIKYLVDQIIVGVVINVLISGLTGFLYTQWLAKDESLLNSPDRFERMAIPGLSQIPIVGPALFNQTIIVYLMYIAIALVTFGLFRTKWGLRLRSVGEHPQAADTVGINVRRTRFWNVSLAGAVAGLGGAFITLGSVGSFNEDMTAGAGFIALAAVIFGRWHPIRATLAALLFGFASNLQNALSVIGSPVPSEFMLMLPYVVTIFAVAGLVGHVRGPASAGKPYVKS